MKYVQQAFGLQRDLDTSENITQCLSTVSLPERCMLGNSKQPSKVLLLNRRHNTNKCRLIGTGCQQYIHLLSPHGTLILDNSTKLQIRQKGQCYKWSLTGRKLLSVTLKSNITPLLSASSYNGHTVCAAIKP